MAEQYYIQFQTYRLSLQRDAFVGDATELTGSGRSPVVLTWDGDDDPLTPFHGLRCSIQYINDGTVPVETFISENEQEWKVVFTNSGNTLFTGFISQEDTTQQYIYQPNQVTLVASDGIGYLRNKTLNDCATIADAYGRKKILDYFIECLDLTGVTLPINVYINLYEQGMSDRVDSATADPFNQAYINNKTFLTSDPEKYISCYEVLEKILKSWRCTLYQSEGEWNIVRMVEYPTMVGTNWDGGVATVAPSFTDRDDLIPINREQIQIIQRPIKSVDNTFDYKIPILLLNANLQNLGSLIGTTVDGALTYNDYNLADWENVGGETAYIRVVSDTTTGRELDRYLILPFVSADTGGVYSNEIEVSEGDRIRFSFKQKSETDSNLSARYGVCFYLQSYDGATEYMLAYVGNVFVTFFSWQTPPLVGSYAAPSVQLDIRRPGRDDMREYVDVDPTNEFDFYNELNGLLPSFPISGNLRIMLAGFNNNQSRLPDKDAIIKDIEFEYFTFINDSTQIIGQNHFIDQTENIRQKIEADIFIDDSPKSNVAGTMFLQDAGGAPVPTELWTDDGYRFSEVQTAAELLFSYLSADRIEGPFKNIVSMKDIIEISGFTGKKFAPIRLSVDYGNGVSRGLFIEVSNTAKVETIGDLVSRYNFKYLYK